MKKCGNCGAVQPDEARFCDACGTPFEETSKTVTLSLMQAVIAYQAGDNNAFQTIYDETEKYIYACVLKVVGTNVNSQAMIEDIMKATYMEIGRSLGQIEQPERFVTWATRVALRNCFAFMNANQPNPYWYELPYGMADQQVSESILPNTIEADVAVQNRVRVIIEQQFTSMEKFCVVSHYYNGVEIEELSQSIGVPSQTIVRNLNSAKTKLCRSLMETERERSTGMSELAPWLTFLFQQDVEMVQVPRRVHDMVKNAIAGIVLGMPGALTSSVVLTGAVQATGSLAVNSAISGTGLSSIAGNATAGAFMGGSAMGGAAGTMGQVAMGGVAGTMGQAAMGAVASNGMMVGAAGTSANAAGATIATGTITNGAAATGTAAAGGAAAGGGVSTGILSSVGAKIAVAVAGAAVVTGGTLAIHHVVTSNNDKEETTITEDVIDDDYLDGQMYRVSCDYDKQVYLYENSNVFASLLIVGDEYRLLANSLAAEMNRYREQVEAQIPEQNEWAQQMGYDTDAEYVVNFKVSRADENIFSCIALEEWNTYTSVTTWEPFVTIDANTGEILELDDVCEVSEIKAYALNRMDTELAGFEQELGFWGGDPDQIKNYQEQYWNENGFDWFLSAEGIGLLIEGGYPVESGKWTMMIPYEALQTFQQKYLPKGVMASEMTCDIGLTIRPWAYVIDTNGDGQQESYNESGSYRIRNNGHGKYYVRNANGQSFFVLPDEDGEGSNGTRVYLLTDNGEVDVTNTKALDLNICSIAGDVAYCRDCTTNEYMYYQVTDQGMLPWNLDLMSHRYELVKEELTWEEAKTEAEARGGHLVTITSYDEQVFVESVAQGTRCWIGGFCDENYENWQWVTGEPWDFTYWAEGEPSHVGVMDNERYLTIWPYEWNDLANESYEQEGYIIEWD